MRTRLRFLPAGSYLLFFSALLISTYCKLRLLDSRELWLDETYSTFVANLPFKELFRFVSGDVHPPLFYSLLWVWIRAVGDAPAQLRLFGLVLNVLSVVAMFMLAKRVLGLLSGAFAASLFAFSPMLFVHGLEVRSYMLFTLVFICLLYVHWVITIEENSSWWLLALYCVLSATLFYIHYLGIFVLAGLLLHRLLVHSRTPGRMKRVGSAAALIVLLVSPQLPTLLRQHAGKARLDQNLALSYSDPQTLSYGSVQQGPGRLQQAGDLVKASAAVAGFYPARSPILLVLLAVPLALALAGVVMLWLNKRDEICQMSGIVAPVCAGGLFALHLGTTRYLVPLTPLLLLALVRALQWGSSAIPWRRTSQVAAALIFTMYAAGFFRQALMQHGHPWENLVSEIQREYRPGDEVVFDVLYAQVPFDYFARRAGFAPQERGFPISNHEWWGKQEFRAWGGPVVLQSDLKRFVATLLASNAKVVWLVLYEPRFYDPRDALLERLREVGEVKEVQLEADPEEQSHRADSPIRLVRVALR